MLLYSLESLITYCTLKQEECEAIQLCLCLVGHFYCIVLPKTYKEAISSLPKQIPIRSYSTPNAHESKITQYRNGWILPSYIAIYSNEERRNPYVSGRADVIEISRLKSTAIPCLCEQHIIRLLVGTTFWRDILYTGRLTRRVTGIGGGFDSSGAGRPALAGDLRSFTRIQPP
jgi:hypothetical protein